MTMPVLQVRDLKVHFPVRTGSGLLPRHVPLKAVDGVSFDLHGGETLGIVGESGCGKSTLGRAILHLLPPTSGTVTWLGKDLTTLDRTALKDERRGMHIVFQDPLASLDPRMSAGDIIAEPLRNYMPELGRTARRARVADMMARVGLAPELMNRYPHEFSGGQCQRIGIARAVILHPRLVICDEPVSALDVSVRAQVVNLLAELQRSMGLSLIFISHDLSVVRHISHRVMVLYLGRIMEIAECRALYETPRHPYTRALIGAVPVPDPARAREKRSTLKMELPSPLDPPSGCVFRTRCAHATEICAEAVPAADSPGPAHEVWCHHWRRLGL